jgi:outer membrane protein OmpA-like peptidoglycan-associated protein
MRRLLLVSCFVSSLALADAVDLSVDARVMKGKLPAVQVNILEPIAGFHLVLEGGGGEKLDVKGGGKPGTTRSISLPQKGEGVTHWKGELSVNAPNAMVSQMALEFDTEILGRMKLEVKNEDIDLPHRKVGFTSNHVVTKAHLKVLTESGALAVDDDLPFDGADAGTKLEATWPQTSSRVMTVDLRVFDRAGLYDSVEVTQWQVDIPHEEVNFDSGKWDVRDDEKGKLDASYKLIADAVEKYGKLATIKLFIAGHTDTVGANAANRTLSLNRAKAIGSYLRRKGLGLPVFYEGFGEEALLVQTADETAEPKNRRAEYIIAIDSPTPTNMPFTPHWQKL